MTETVQKRVLDLRGLKCPLPVLRTRKAMRDVPAGEILAVMADDPASVIDFPVFCHETGLELVSERRDGDALTFEIRKPVGEIRSTAGRAG